MLPPCIFALARFGQWWLRQYHAVWRLGLINWLNVMVTLIKHTLKVKRELEKKIRIKRETTKNYDTNLSTASEREGMLSRWPLALCWQYLWDIGYGFLRLSQIKRKKSQSQKIQRHVNSCEEWESRLSKNKIFYYRQVHTVREGIINIKLNYDDITL